MPIGIPAKAADALASACARDLHCSVCQCCAGPISRSGERGRCVRWRWWVVRCPRRRAARWVATSWHCPSRAGGRKSRWDRFSRRHRPWPASRALCPCAPVPGACLAQMVPGKPWCCCTWAMPHAARHRPGPGCVRSSHARRLPAPAALGHGGPLAGAATARSGRLGAATSAAAGRFAGFGQPHAHLCWRRAGDAGRAGGPGPGATRDPRQRRFFASRPSGPGLE